MTYSIQNRWSKFFVEISGEEGLAAMTRVFGVDSISPVEHECENDLEQMKELIVKHYADTVSGKSFAVRVKRTGVRALPLPRQSTKWGDVLGLSQRVSTLKIPRFR